MADYGKGYTVFQFFCHARLQEVDLTQITRDHVLFYFIFQHDIFQDIL